MLSDLEQQVQQIIKRGEGSGVQSDGQLKTPISSSPQLAYSDAATVNSNLAVKAGQSTQEEENNLAILLGNLGELDKKLQVSSMTFPTFLILLRSFTLVFAGHFPGPTDKTTFCAGCHDSPDAKHSQAN